MPRLALALTCAALIAAAWSIGTAVSTAGVGTALSVPEPLRAAPDPVVAMPPPPEATSLDGSPNVRVLPIESIGDAPLAPRAPQPALGALLERAGPPPADPGRARSLAGLVSHGDRTSNRVAITIDMDGGPRSYEIVDWLARHNVPATIFAEGRDLNVSEIDRQALRLAATRPDLFEIGNHSYSHVEFTRLSNEQIARDLAAASASIERVIGSPPLPWFRPPYGDHDARVREAVVAAGYPLIVLWDVDPQDWRRGRTAEQIASFVVSRARGGSIVLLHFSGHATLEALPLIVDGLNERGLQPVNVGQLLAG